MKLVILTGAGMSAESGIKTFRDSDGLWENYRIEDVCTPEALERNPELVNHFYNERRKQLYEAQPNAGHKGLAGLENYFSPCFFTPASYSSTFPTLRILLLSLLTNCPSSCKSNSSPEAKVNTAFGEPGTI
jgi:hypothetical protein